MTQGNTYAVLGVKQGDTFVQTLTVRKGDAVVNLTGATVTLHVREPGGDADRINQPLNVESPAAGGVCSLRLSPAQTAALTAGVQYTYEVELLDTAGDVSTVIEGVVTVQADRG